MCLLIFKPEKIRIPEDVLQQSFENNKDGAGFMYVKDHRIHIVKGLMTFDEFIKAYRPIAGKKAVIHFRVGNKGKLTKENTHPHRISKDLAFAHNGTIDIYPLTGDNSDTVEFCDRVLKKLPEDFIEREEIMRLIVPYVKKSRLVFLRSDGEVVMVNSNEGTWVDGVWYSNDSYKKKPVTTPYYGSTGTGHNQAKKTHYLRGEKTCAICGIALLTTDPEISTGYCSPCMSLMGCPYCYVPGDISKPWYELDPSLALPRQIRCKSCGKHPEKFGRNTSLSCG